MSSENEILDTEKKENGISALHSSISTLSYIGNAIWIFLFGLLLLGCVLNGKAMLESISLDNFLGGIVMLFGLVSFLFILLCGCCIVGVKKMKKGEKKGLYLYSICNGLWSVILIYASEGDWIFLAMAAISVLFIIYFVLNSKKLS